MASDSFRNPFRPGEGHMPPYLAGREKEKQEFNRFLDQEVILENVILTGLRGVGKTVLMETFKPLAIQKGWLWVGTDMSESISVSEDRLATRLLADLSFVTSGIELTQERESTAGFHPIVEKVTQKIDYAFLRGVYDQTPGMPSDKIKAVLELAWRFLCKLKVRGVIFAYDESQNLSDNAGKDEYPLSLLLDVFQSIQRKNIPFMLVLTGLPTLFAKLVKARTYAERMFHVVFLDRLNEKDSRDAIHKPIEDANCPVKMSNILIDGMIEISGGYPYFIQFLGRECYDVVLQRIRSGGGMKQRRAISVPFDEIVRKLDNDFFAGRWSRADGQAARSHGDHRRTSELRQRVYSPGGRGEIERRNPRQALQLQPRKSDDRLSVRSGPGIQEPPWKVLLRGSAVGSLHKAFQGIWRISCPAACVPLTKLPA